jgi:hypothetical protein
VNVISPKDRTFRPFAEIKEELIRRMGSCALREGRIAHGAEVHPAI